MTARVLQWSLQQLTLNRKVAIASVVDTSGSVPGKAGARLALTDSEIVGTVGGAGLEMKVISRLRELISQASKPCGEVVTYGLNKGAKGYEVQPLDSLCGGRVTVALEVLIPMPHILLMGGGHCAKAIAEACRTNKINGKILGPVSAPIFRLRKKYRIRLLIRGPKSLRLQNSLATFISNYKFPNGIKLSVDVDPISFN